MRGVADGGGGVDYGLGGHFGVCGWLRVGWAKGMATVGVAKERRLL